MERACYSLYVAGDFEVLFFMSADEIQKLTFLSRLKRKTTVIHSVLMILLMICCLLGKKVNTEIAKS